MGADVNVHALNSLPAQCWVNVHTFLYFLSSLGFYLFKNYYSMSHMGQYQLLSVLAARLSPLNIDHSRNLPVEICGVNYTEKYTNL